MAVRQSAMCTNPPEPGISARRRPATGRQRRGEVGATRSRVALNRIRIPVVQISPTLAETLVAGTGRTLEALSASAESPGGSSPVALPGVRVEITTDVRRESQTARNVVGLIEGSDPELKDEWIVICAHFDHDGADGSVIYNGADDDGSGTVALIEIAEAYQEAVRWVRGPAARFWSRHGISREGAVRALAYVETRLPLERPWPC